MYDIGYEVDSYCLPFVGAEHVGYSLTGLHSRENKRENKCIYCHLLVIWTEQNNRRLAYLAQSLACNDQVKNVRSW